MKIDPGIVLVSTSNISSGTGPRWSSEGALLLLNWPMLRRPRCAIRRDPQSLDVRPDCAGARIAFAQ